MRGSASAPPNSMPPPSARQRATGGSTRRATPTPPFIDSPDWMRLPLAGYPRFRDLAAVPRRDPQPSGARRRSAARHNFRGTIDIPGFHVTSWFDIFQTSVIAAFQEIQARTGTQKLWIGPNEHYFVYAENFWPRDPYFEWFDYWLKDETTDLIDEPAVFYSPRAWVADRAAYRPDDWRHAERWPPPGVTPRRLYLRGDGSSSERGRAARAARYRLRPAPPGPDLGGRNMLIDPGPLDQRPAQALPDYGLIYAASR